jgi:crotonobetainyl-CoA:carnitine CoA-transferase CaiB-like acyl-CoA transferase
LLEHSITGRMRRSEGFQHPLLCPHGNYRVAGRTPAGDEDAWLSIAVGSEAEWLGLLEVIGVHHWPSPDAQRWGLAERKAHRSEIDGSISRWATAVEGQSAVAQLQSAGVAAYLVGSIADVFVDPQLTWRGTFINLEHPLVGVEPMPGLPWQFSDISCEVRRRAPLLGEHSSEVLEDWLGLSPDDPAHLVTEPEMQTQPTT